MKYEMINCTNEEIKYKRIMNDRLRLDNPKALLVVDNSVIQKKVLRYFKKNHSILSLYNKNSNLFNIIVLENMNHSIEEYDVYYFISQVTLEKTLLKFPFIESRVKLYSTPLENLDLKRIVQINQKAHLNNEDIPLFFWESFIRADDELLVSSPWLGKFILEEKYQKHFKYALSNNVTIVINYGIGGKNSARDSSSDKISDILKKSFIEYSENFIINKVNSHYKIMICDEKFLIKGSYNFLSFEGKYEKDTRTEGADIIFNKKEIIQMKKQYFGR